MRTVNEDWVKEWFHVPVDLASSVTKQNRRRMWVKTAPECFCMLKLIYLINLTWQFEFIKNVFFLKKTSENYIPRGGTLLGFGDPPDMPSSATITFTFVVSGVISQVGFNEIIPAGPVNEHPKRGLHSVWSLCTYKHLRASIDLPALTDCVGPRASISLRSTRGGV